MANDNSNSSEHDRIRDVYDKRTTVSSTERYAWWQPDVMGQNITRKLKLAQLLKRHVGKELSNLDMLDVGCGSGELLRQMVEWGASPSRLIGIDLLEDRLIAARAKSHADIRYANMGIESVEAPADFDVVSAFTVFSSILDNNLRAELAQGMWSRVRAGGNVLLFDFRMNNPGNQDVRKVTRQELTEWWPDATVTDYRSVLLAPPVARRISKLSVNLALNIEVIAPFLRSHFYYVATKPAG